MHDYNHAKMALKHGRVIWKNGCFNILRFYALEFVKEFHKGIEINNDFYFGPYRYYCHFSRLTEFYWALNTRFWFFVII